MSDEQVSDSWERGNPSEEYVGRWSRRVAPRFLAWLGVAPGRCVVVEDSRYGVEAARAAGMRAFGYAGGLTPARRLAGPGTVVFTDTAELPGLISRVEILTFNQAALIGR